MGYMDIWYPKFEKCTHNAQNYFPDTMTDSEDDGKIRKIHTPTYIRISDFEYHRFDDKVIVTWAAERSEERLQVYVIIINSGEAAGDDSGEAAHRVERDMGYMDIWYPKFKNAPTTLKIISQTQ